VRAVALAGIRLDVRTSSDGATLRAIESDRPINRVAHSSYSDRLVSYKIRDAESPPHSSKNRSLK
jgi:hypothetical protein